MTVSLYSLMSLLGAAHGLFLALALFTSRLTSNRANIFLGGLMLAFVATLVDNFFSMADLENNYLWVRILLWPYDFFYGAFIYLYVCAVSEQKPLGRVVYHFVPSLIYILLTWPLLLIDPALLIEGTLQPNLINSIWLKSLMFCSTYLSYIHIGCYLFWCLWLLQVHQKKVANQYSYTEKVSLRWLKMILSAMTGLYLIWLFIGVLPIPQTAYHNLDSYLGLSLVILVYAMGYLGLKQPVIFMLQNPKHDDDKHPINHPVQWPIQLPFSDQTLRYKKSTLPEGVTTELTQVLTNLMVRDQLYLDAKISSPQLAGHMGISTSYLLQIINNQLGMNFFDFINRYRIEAATSLLQTTNLNITEIAQDIGFHSKYAFYAAFKKYQGTTPGHFRKQRSSH